MTPVSASGLQRAAAPSNLSAPRSKDTPEKILDAARQFEALLMGQLLRGMQDGEGDGWGGEDDAEDSMIGGIGQQQFALALSQHGGLGLTQSIASGLTRAETDHHSAGKTSAQLASGSPAPR